MGVCNKGLCPPDVGIAWWVAQVQLQGPSRESRLSSIGDFRVRDETCGGLCRGGRGGRPGGVGGYDISVKSVRLQLTVRLGNARFRGWNTDRTSNRCAFPVVVMAVGVGGLSPPPPRYTPTSQSIDAFTPTLLSMRMFIRLFMRECALSVFPPPVNSCA